MIFSENEMKPIFCIDVTSDKKNEALNGAEFITRTTSKQKLEKYETSQESLEETVKKSEIPLWLQIVRSICGIFFLIVLGATAKAGLNKAMKNAPFLIIIGAICGIVWLTLVIISKMKSKKVLKEENADQKTEDINKDIKSIHNELRVPESALDVDVLIFKYKVKDGKICPFASGFQTTAYINLDVKAYVEEDKFCIADLENVYSFDKSELMGITTVEKRISVPVWNKKEDPRKGIYKPYKLTVNNLGDVFFKPYHILNISHNSQSFGIYFPCYDLEAFETLTGLKAKN